MSRGVTPQPSVLFAHGERYGSLTVIERAMTKQRGAPKYKVGCACGHIFIAKGSHLRKGRVKACAECTQSCANRT